MNLRPYQQDTIFHLLNSQFERECVCLPTGSGKTYIFSIFSGIMVEHGKKIVIAVHRTELLEQARGQIEKETGLQVGIITAGTRHYPQCPVIICMVETISRRKQQLEYLSKNYDILIVDECHIGNFNKILEPFKRVIGFSATPIALRKADCLANHYKELYVPLQISDLIPKYLSPPVFYGYPNAAKAKEFKMNATGTDYDEKFMGDMLSAPKFIEVAGSYVKKFCAGKKAIIYNASISHSLTVTQHLREMGFNAFHLDGKTPMDERKMILAKLYTEKECIVSNVGVLTTGFDCPEVEVILLNRLTKSLSLYIQMAGRGSRLSNIIHKENFYILDLCNNFELHGFWQDARDWDALFKKKGSDGKGAAPTKMCKSCGYIAPIQTDICPDCGAEFEKAQDHSKNSVDPQLIKIEYFKKEMNSIMEQVHQRGQNVYRGLHLLKEKIYFSSPQATLPDLQEQLLTQLPNWCKETGKKHNQWHKDMCHLWMKEFYDKHQPV